jgi:hypothetical protein
MNANNVRLVAHGENGMIIKQLSIGRNIPLFDLVVGRCRSGSRIIQTAADFHVLLIDIREHKNIR